MTRKSLLVANTDRQDRNVGVRRHRQHRRQIVRVDAGARRESILRFLTPGAVVMADVPFRDVEESKLRPVVVLSVAADGVEVLPCTGSDRRHAGRVAVVELCDLASAGLIRATGVRGEVITLTPDRLAGVVGSLSDIDRYTVFSAFATCSVPA